MAIEKKSLISTLQSTKKANIAKEVVATDGTSKATALKASPVLKLARKAAAKNALARKMARK